MTNDISVIALFAHPDDETMLCGGALALLARLDVPVHFVCATRGEGGEMGDPPLTTRDLLGEVRSREMECAVKALNGASLHFLGYVDPPVGPGEELYSFETTLAELVRQVQRQVDQVGANAIITHGSNGEYGHPAHRMVHQAAIEVARRSAPRMALHTVQAAWPGHPKPRIANPADPADLVIDVRPLLDQKIFAARCHRTQHALFVRRASQDLGRPVGISEVVMEEESLHRVLLDGECTPPDALTRLLLDSGLAVPPQG